MLKIPYGISDYRVLKEENYYYVDKTNYLEKLENIGKVLVYLRPGRFGKTLFTSMLYYYYDVNSKEKFSTLFKDTYVLKHPTPNKNNYYILKLDFSGVSTLQKNSQELEIEFKNKVISSLTRFNESYDSNIQVNHNNSPNGIILEFLDSFNALGLKNKLYILIDEYDNFTNAILEGSGDKFKGAVGKSGFIRGFYAVIKEYCGLGIVDRVFITGICPITMDSMTTGFNIATDISNDIRFHSMIGLTYDEVRKLIQGIDSDKREEIYNLMVKNYDGYLFRHSVKEKVFNATLVMYFLKNYYDFEKVPEELLDKNIAFNYGKIGDLLRLQHNKYYEEILNTILKTGTINGFLKTNYNLEVDFDRDDIISLLYYFGYLTIQEKDIFDDSITFKIPNYVMSGLYNKYFLKILRDIQIEIDNSMLKDSVKEMALVGKIDTISNYISEILRKSDNRIFMKFDEKYIQLLYFSLLSGNKNFKVYSEYPTENGYIDLLILSNSEISKYDIMIELKYIKAHDYKKRILEEKVKEAREQILKYSEDERISKDKLRRYIVIFVGHHLKLIEEV